VQINEFICTFSIEFVILIMEVIMGFNYKDSGVDVEAGYKSVELIKKHVQSTMRPEVLGGIGGFGGMFSLGKIKHMQEPVLVSGTDGVGTKLRIAFEINKHDTIGIDCVAMCVNDIICSGAEPLFFLDYIACGKNTPEQIEEIVKGVADGCCRAGASLVGGETAEMPGFYTEDEYDIAGFAVGVVDKPNIIDGSAIADGDVLIGIASSGVHSNGFSLVRKIVSATGLSFDTYAPELAKTVGEALLEPTKIYVKPVLNLIKNVNVKGICHITGGGFIENIPRMMPDGLTAEIACGTWDMAPIFEFLREKASLNLMDMYNTFNMGIGMVVAVAASDADKTIESLKTSGENSWVIGKVKPGAERVEVCLK